MLPVSMLIDRVISMGASSFQRLAVRKTDQPAALSTDYFSQVAHAVGY